MNKLDVINKINKEFKGKALGLDGKCTYLNNKGQKCAIGIFIPDGHNAQWAGYGLLQLVEEYPDLYEVLPDVDISILREFQRVHDNELHAGMSLEEQKRILIDFVNDNF